MDERVEQTSVAERLAYVGEIAQLLDCAVMQAFEDEGFALSGKCHRHVRLRRCCCAGRVDDVGKMAIKVAGIDKAERRQLRVTSDEVAHKYGKLVMQEPLRILDPRWTSQSLTEVGADVDTYLLYLSELTFRREACQFSDAASWFKHRPHIPRTARLMMNANVLEVKKISVASL